MAVPPTPSTEPLFPYDQPALSVMAACVAAQVGCRVFMLPPLTSRVKHLSSSAVPLGIQTFLSLTIYLLSANSVNGSPSEASTAPCPAHESFSPRDLCVMRSHDFVLRALSFLSYLSRMAATVGLRVGCLRFLALFVLFLDRLDVSLFCELYVHCQLEFFPICYTSVEVFGSWYSVLEFLS